MNPMRYFRYPDTAGQKQYEALRSFYLDHVPGREVARRFSYTYAAFNSLRHRFKSGLLDFFITPPPGPKGPRVPTEIKNKIIELRRKSLSVEDIANVLETTNEKTSVSTIARVLEQEGFPKLTRRSHLKIGITKNNTIVPEYARSIDLSEVIHEWQGECAVGGIFLFAPLIEYFGIPDMIQRVKLPETKHISSLNYVLSMLALKLVGKERLSQINDFNFDQGLGLFAGLNVLPKSTSISTYSYRLSQKAVRQTMKAFVEKQNRYKTYGSEAINLDFHTIQHYGDASVLDSHWSGTRNKRVKGALTLIAQDGDSKCQLYVDADILRRDADEQVLEFVKFWKSIQGKFRQTLVFDSKLTTYENLRQLNDDNVKFITLRRRGKSLVDAAHLIPHEKWKKITIDSPKRKFKCPRIYDENVMLEGYGTIRQIIMKDNGREEPAFFITNDFIRRAQTLVQLYSKRWNVENSIEEAISFFNLNALSSPILIKIHFDVLLTMIADTLYYHLAQSLKGFEKCNAEKIFRHFIDMPATIKITGQEINIRYPLRAHSPVLRSAGLDKWAPAISWLGERKLNFIWG